MFWMVRPVRRPSSSTSSSIAWSSAYFRIVSSLGLQVRGDAASDEERGREGQLLLVEGLAEFGGKRGELQAVVDVARGATGELGDALGRVELGALAVAQRQEALVLLGLLERVWVLALEVLERAESRRNGCH